MEATGIWSGPTNNVIVIGSEGSGKTSALFTIITRLIAAKKLNRFAALSPALSPTSPKTDFTWCGRISKDLCEFNRIPALTDDGVHNYEVMEEAFAVSIGKKSCAFIDDHGSKLLTIIIATPEGDVTLAKYLYGKACTTSSTGVFLVMAVQSAISGKQDFCALYRQCKHRLFFGGLDDELDRLRKPYESWRLGLKKAFAALQREPQGMKTVRVLDKEITMYIPGPYQRFVYANGCTKQMHFMFYWRMDSGGRRQVERPILKLPILDQNGYLLLLSEYGQLLQEGDSSVMFQKASVDEMFVDVDVMLQDGTSSDAASAAAPPKSPQTFGSPFSGAGTHFQPFHKCCKHP